MQRERIDQHVGNDVGDLIAPVLFLGAQCIHGLNDGPLPGWPKRRKGLEQLAALFPGHRMGVE